MLNAGRKSKTVNINILGTYAVFGAFFNYMSRYCHTLFIFVRNTALVHCKTDDCSTVLLSDRKNGIKHLIFAVNAVYKCFSVVNS